MREVDGWPQLDGLAQDLRHAVRSLLRRPGFAGVAVLVLSVGIGVNTAVFSLVNAVLLRPLPAVRAPQELLYLYSDSRESGLGSLTYGDYLLLREGTAGFTGMFAVSRDRATLWSGRETRPVNGECVSANYFGVLGVSPVIGRPFGASDDDPEADPVALPALDWLTFVTVPPVLAAIVLLACYLPARRAARTDLTVSLRTQ